MAAKKLEGISVNVGVCELKLKKIKVTAAHIKKGHKGDAASCPIALAVRDALGPAGKDASISIDSSSQSFSVTKTVRVPVTVCGERQDDYVREVQITGELNLGSKAGKFIETFDEQGAKGVSPTTFNAKLEIDQNVYAAD